MELLATIGQEKRGFGVGDTFQPVFISASASIDSVERLQDALIRATKRVLDDGQEPRNVGKSGVKVGIPSIIEYTKEFGPEPSDPSPSNVSDEWNALVGSGKRLLFVVDEFDILPQFNGVSGFFKQYASDHIRFMPIGIANTVAGLLEDHQSVERVITPVEIPQMGGGELWEIVQKASATLAEKIGSGFDVEFRARERIIEIAGGFPWFVHLIGRDALLLAHERDGDLRILEADVEGALGSLVTNDLAQPYADLYRRSVSNSFERETVLRALARWPHRDIPIPDICWLARHASIQSPEQHVLDLQTEEFGEAIQFHPTDGDAVRFQSRMFQHYINLRESQYHSVRERLEEAWKGRIEKMRKDADEEKKLGPSPGGPV